MRGEEKSGNVVLDEFLTPGKRAGRGRPLHCSGIGGECQHLAQIQDSALAIGGEVRSRPEKLSFVLALQNFEG
jgi:hypothetical protein